MIVTSEHTDPAHQMYEADILVSLLGFPGGISALGIRDSVGRMALSLGLGKALLQLVKELLQRLQRYKLVDCVVNVRPEGSVTRHYHLTAAGWLKAVTLGRLHSSKDRT